MSRTTITATLEPHAKRPIRAFLADKAIAGTNVERAFWDALYHFGPRVTAHEEAQRIANALENSSERVERVIEGWRP
jgi:hypothetical protein